MRLTGAAREEEAVSGGMLTRLTPPIGPMPARPLDALPPEGRTSALYQPKLWTGFLSQWAVASSKMDTAY
jgi:hypothetical protein